VTVSTCDLIQTYAASSLVLLLLVGSEYVGIFAWMTILLALL